MIKEIKRKWNQHKCIPSPQNKDYWRNCWAFLELQATTKTIQTGAVLGYKISILVCLWTVCFVATNVRGKQSWWQRHVLGDALHHKLMGTETHEPQGLQECSSNEGWILNPQMQPIHPARAASSRGGDPKHIDLRSPRHLLPCQLSHHDWFYAWF